MANPESIFKVGKWLVEPDLLHLRSGETVLRLEPKVMSLLVFLAGAAPRVVSREEIFEAVWEGRAVVDESLTRAVSLLRQALGDNAKNPGYIETIPTKGYRLIAQVERPASAATRPAEPSALSPPAVHARRTWLLFLLLVSLLAALVFSKQWRGGTADIGTVATPVTVAGETARPAIAIVPFANLSGDPKNLYLSDGLTEELIHQLSAIGGLQVVSRASSMQLRDSEEPAPAIAKELGVDYLLEGSVLVVEDRVRIRARLIDLESDEHLFSRSYDRGLEEILHVQRTVALDVARETQVRLTVEEQIRLAASTPIEPEAYRLYLKGLQALRSRTPEGIRLAPVLLRRAVERAPSFASAWSALADAHLLSVQFRLEGDGHAAAQKALDQALAIDPDLASAHCALGLLHATRDQDWEKSEASYLRAIALEPSYATAHQWYSEMLAFAGRYEEAVDRVRIALDLDPLSPLMHAVTGQRLSAAGRYQEAIWEYETAEELGAAFVWYLKEWAWAWIRLGNEERALAALRLHVEGQGANSTELATLDATTAALGLPGYWSWTQAKYTSLPDPTPLYFAESHAALEETEEALHWLAKTLETEVFWFLHGQRSPAFDYLRDDPRYLELVGDYPLWRP